MDFNNSHWKSGQSYALHENMMITTLSLKLQAYTTAVKSFVVARATRILKPQRQSLSWESYFATMPNQWDYWNSFSDMLLLIVYS